MAAWPPIVSAMGSAGTIAAGDRLKQLWPEHKIVGLEPVQCPTLSLNGYGEHDIQGIGDKHVTWIHNVLNMDAIACIDDLECKKGLQLLTEEAGWWTLVQRYGVPEQNVRRMAGYFGISGVCNVLGAIKAAKFHGLGERDLVVTILHGCDRPLSFGDGADDCPLWADGRDRGGGAAGAHFPRAEG